MAVSAADVVAPVFATAEVVVLFSPRMTGQTRFRDLFRRLVLERNDLGRIAFLRVGLAWSMTSLTTGHPVVPPLQTAGFGVRRGQEIFELVLMAVVAGFAADVLVLTRCGLVVMGGGRV